MTMSTIIYIMKFIMKLKQQMYFMTELLSLWSAQAVMKNTAWLITLGAILEIKYWCVFTA